MSNTYTQFQILRGDSASNAAYVGRPGELTADMDNNILRLHDGTTPGGTIIGSGSGGGGGGATFPYTGNAVITGSLWVSGSYNNFSGITGSLLGSASYADTTITASYISGGIYIPEGLIITGSTYVTGTLEVTNGITGSLLGTSSWAISASYAVNAGAGSGFPFSGSAVITGSLLISSSGLYLSGSGVTGSLLGTASNAISASYAVTASRAISASRADSSEKVDVLSGGSTTGLGIYSGSFYGTSSWAVTASYALNGSGGTGTGFPFSGSAVITGSLLVSSSGIYLSGSGLTGSVLGTSSWANNSISASHATFAVSSSRSISTEKVDVLSGGSTTGLGIYSGSFYGTASQAITASYALNAGSGGGSGFPFSGSAVITGSLLISSSGIYLSGSGLTGSVLGTSSWANNSISASHATFAISSSRSISTEKVDVLSGGSTTGLGIYSGSFFGTSSWAVSASYAANSGQGVGFPFSGSAVITGSLLISSSGIYLSGSGLTGSVLGTSSWASNAISASYATFAMSSSRSISTEKIDVLSGGSTTGLGVYSGSFFGTSSWAVSASYAANSGQGVGFPFSGSAVITGSLLISSSGIYLSGSGVTGSLLGTASNAISASYAVTASRAISTSRADSSEKIDVLSGGSTTGLGIYSGSFFGTSSWAVSASYAVNSGAGTVGPGTVNSIALFSSSTAISSSNIFQSSSNIGIGTSSPAYKLDIIGRMRARSDGVASAGHWLTDNTGTTDVFTGLLGVSSTDSWGVYSAGSWRLVVKNGGNVGIGTTNPTAIFHVASNAGMYYTNTDFAAGSVGSGVVIGTGATSGNTYGTIYGFQAGNTSYANLVVPGGNVGIGTTSPDTRLHVSAADTNGLLRLARTGTFAGSGILYANSNDMFGVTDGTNYPFLVNQGATTNTLVVSGSNVGIGTTSATNRLQVQGNVSASSYTSSISNAVGYFGTASWAVSASRGISTEKVDVLSGGSTTGLGIYSGSFSGSLTGTSTSASYAITASYALNAGSGGVTINNNTDNYLVTATGTANTLNGESTVTLDGTTFTANTTNFVVNSTNITVGNDTTDVVGIGNNTVYVSSSKVGIGTTSPASLLDIKYKDGSTNLYRATDTGGQYRWRVDQNFEMLLTNGSGTDLVKIGQTENYFNNGNVGIGTTSPIDGAKLDVRSGKIVAGTGGSTGGSVTIQNYYTDGALSLWGSMYSSGGPMMGYGVKSSTTTANSFLSATGINISRGAYIIEGNVHRWYNGAGQTVAIDSAVTMTERMTMNENGNLAVDTDTLYVDAVNNRVGIGSTSPVVSLDVAGSAMRVGSGVSTAEASLSVGEGRSGTGYAYIDLVGDTTYTDYGFRIIRNNSGANTSSEIVHRGTGQFNITTIEAAGLQLATSNTARLNILSGGNVGIRTTSPSYELDVAGNIRASGSAAGIINNSTSPTLYLQDSDHRSAMVHVNSNTFYVLRGDGTNSLSWAQVGGYWPLVIDLENNNATFGGTLSSSGSLSVGTGNISLGGVTFATYDTSYHTIRRRDGGVGIYLGGADQANYYDNQAHYFRDRSSNTTMTVDTTNARVGIGTTSPSYKLDIGVSVAAASTPSTTLRLNNTSDGGHRILFSNSVAATLAAIDADIESSGTGTDDSIIKFWTATNGSMTEKVRIDKSGNVGIGNTAPVAKLYVEGGSANWNETTPGTSNGTIHLDPGVTTDNFGNAITFGASDSSNGETAQAGIYVRSDGTYGTKMYFATTDAYVSGAKTRMYISEGGNVGIGTTSPGEKLEVNGNAKASDFILSSDRRKKTELLTIDSGLNKVLTLSGYTYKPIDGDRRRAGLMAQDVEEILPEAVYTDDEGYKSLSYEQVIPLLVEAIKELNNKVKLLEENSVK